LQKAIDTAARRTRVKIAPGKKPRRAANNLEQKMRASCAMARRGRNQDGRRKNKYVGRAKRYQRRIPPGLSQNQQVVQPYFAHDLYIRKSIWNVVQNGQLRRYAINLKTINRKKPNSIG
jgi:hypothetical protein